MNTTTTAAPDGNSDRSGDWDNDEALLDVVAIILLLCCALLGVYCLLSLGRREARRREARSQEAGSQADLPPLAEA